MTAPKLVDVERRVASIEADLKKIKTDIHASKNAQMKMEGTMKTLNEGVEDGKSAVVEAKRAVIEAKQAVAAVQADTSEILYMLNASKGIIGFGKKWGRAIIIAAIGAGFFNPKVTAFLTSIFS